MRTFITLMAAGLLAISVGCAPEAETSKATPPAKPETKAPEAKTNETKTVSSEEGKKPAEAESTGEFQTVSLKLPGMT